MATFVPKLAKFLGVDDLILEMIRIRRESEFVDKYYMILLNKYYRRKIEETAKEVGSDFSLWFDNEKSVNEKTVIGDNVHFNGINIRGDGPVTIGDNFRQGSGCEIITENHAYDEGDRLPYGDSYVTKSVEIDDNVWFGIDVTVLPGVSIGEGAIIQAGSVVTSDIPEGAIAGGHPAEVFDYRDMDHYEELKSAGKFR